NLDLRLRNIFGDGREVSVVSDRRASSRSNFRVAYSQPLFWLGLGQIESFISTRNYKNEFYEFALETNYRTTIKEDLFGGAGISVRRVEPVSGVDRYVRFQGDFRFEGRGLDVMRNPGRGFVFDWTLSYIHRKYDKRLIDTLRNDGSSFNDTRATFSADLYQPIAGKFRAHIGADYMGFETAEKLPPLSEMIPLGGPGSLRGYRSEQFFVQRSVFGTVEPRLRFENGTLFTFIDAAYLNRPILETRTAAGSVITEELFRYSYGVGISLLTEERSLMLSLGWNPELRLSQPQVSIELSSDL
ncbi:MAG: BamA/TamA family outer membrane protein, partial [candidate division Zixibacteria bacterium]|nr:BamA/TamA family outer membrane protein [candidate division Zixibacteria bacterium]